MSKNAIDWFLSYLSKCRQCIKYNGVRSDYEQIVCCVPQESIYGPILCIVYVNDLLRALPDSSTIAYTDDLTITTAGSSIEKASLSLQDLLTAIYASSA